MPLDRRHLIGSAALLGGSILYNIWVFWGPAPGEAPGPRAAVDTVAAQVSAEPSGAPALIDPRQIPPPPAVDLTTTPDWTRDPFRAPGDLAIAPADAQPAVLEAPEPDPVVGAILFSPVRRLAIVNGTTVGIGDRINTAVIVDITRDAILVQSPDGEVRTLTLTRPSSREVR